MRKPPPNKGCTGRWGFCGIFEHFPRFEFFLLSNRVHARHSASNANIRSSDIEGFARSLAAAVGAGGQAAAETNEARWVAAIGKDLQAHRGRSVVMAGEFQPPAVHALAHAINQTLGNIGATVTYGGAIEPHPVSQHASLAELSTAMEGGQVQLLVILGNNPVFTAPADVKFGERLAKVGLVVITASTRTRHPSSRTGISRTRTRWKRGGIRAPTTVR